MQKRTRQTKVFSQKFVKHQNIMQNSDKSIYCFFNTKTKRCLAPLGIQHNHKKNEKKRRKTLGEPKTSYSSMKNTYGTARAGNTCLIFFVIVLLMRDEMRNFTKWYLPET